MSCECVVKKMEKTGDELTLLLSKIIKGPLGCTFPIDGRITINSTYAFTTIESRKDLILNQGNFAAKISD